jgi:hypothetical protein
MDTLQASLNLMALGKDEESARKMAFQGQFNSSILSGFSQYMSQSPAQFFANQLVSKDIGIDINKTMLTGELHGTKKGTKQLNKELDDLISGENYGEMLMYLSSIGISPLQAQGWRQKRIKPLDGAEQNGEAGLSPMQQLVDQVYIQATTVNIIDKSPQNRNFGFRPDIEAFMPPSAYSGGTNPAK